MRVLLLSDIHSNLEALEACLATAPAYDVVVNLGDIVGYGASPNEVIERSRSLGKFFVRGNHDKAASGLMDLKDFNPIAGMAAIWTREHVSPENLQWLRSLPQGPIYVDGLDGVQFVHGSPMDEDDYVVTLHDAIEPLMVSPTPLTFFGHSHLQGTFWSNTVTPDVYRPVYRTVGQAETVEFPLREGQHYLVNPGSVGQPRDGDWRAGFAILDMDRQEVEYYRAPYEVAKTQAKMREARLPEPLIRRLELGR